MKIGYMTNAWGAVVGHPGSVTSVKDAFYLSTGEDEQAIKEISDVGFHNIEVFDGNLVAYASEMSKFSDLLNKYGVNLLAVYSGANFIYNEILNEELFKMEQAMKMAKQLGAKHVCIGGGAVRSDGIKALDYAKLAAGLDKAMVMATDMGLIASYHPHLGTCVQTPDQLDKLMPLTKIHLCPDCGHIAAGGGNPVETVRKYKDRIVYLHLKDYKDGGFYPLGMGLIDFKEIISILSTNEVKVDYTIEADGYAGSPKEAAGISYEYLKKVGF
jgi:inosose dehydratase